MDCQFAARGHGVNIAGHADRLVEDIFLEFLQGFFFKSYILIGLFQITACCNDPIPGLEVPISHNLVSRLSFPQAFITPGIDDVKHFARFCGDRFLAHLPDKIAPLLILSVKNIFAFLSDVDGQVAFGGHGIEIAGFAYANVLERLSDFLLRLRQGVLTARILLLLNCDEAVGKLRQGSQIVVNGPPLVFLVHLKLLIVRVQEVQGELGHVLQIGAGSLRNAHIRLLLGDIADDHAHAEHRQQHQGQNHRD